MSDLSDWGGGVDDGDGDESSTDEQDEQRSGQTYRRGRCPAISTGTRKRCAAPISRMKAADGFCGVHGREDDPWTIHDDPETLLLLTGKLDALSLDELEEDAVDFDLARIQRAVDAVQGADHA